MPGETIALRCTCVIRGISNPFVVLVISIKEDALGVLVPIPALPLAGNIFCALSCTRNKQRKMLSVKITFFIWCYFRTQRFACGNADCNTRKGENVKRER